MNLTKTNLIESNTWSKGMGVISWVVGCGSFMSWQHIRSYQDEYQLVTMHSWWLYSAAPLGHQFMVLVASSHYPDTEPTSPFPILIMLSAWLGSDNYQFSCHWFDSTWFELMRSKSPYFPKQETTLNSFGLPVRSVSSTENSWFH